MKINQYIANAKTFAELEPIADKAVTGLTFWGKRYITVEGFKGSAHLSYLTIHAIEIIKKNPHFNEKERADGKAFSAKLDLLYDKMQVKVMSSNGFTWLLTFFRRFFCLNEGKWNVVNIDRRTGLDGPGYQDVFNCYTSEQAKNANKPIRYYISLGGFSDYNDWVLDGVTRYYLSYPLSSKDREFRKIQAKPKRIFDTSSLQRPPRPKNTEYQPKIINASEIQTPAQPCEPYIEWED